MLDLFILIFCAMKIGRLAASKNLSSRKWIIRLVLFWLSGEFAGAIIGLAIFGKENVISCMIVAFAVGLSAYFIINNHLSKLPDNTNQ